MPLFASGKFSGQSRRGLYGDVVEEIDWSVGQVLDALRREGLDRNTLVFFTSDNGPWLTQGEAGGSAGPLRDGKGSTWEGGMREPGIAWWPGRVPAGVVTHELACTMDLFTTSLKLAGAEIPQDRIIDGLDIAAAACSAPGRVRGRFSSITAARSFTPFARVLQGPLHHPVRLRPRQARAARSALLFHLGHDPSERFDVAADAPRRAGRHRQGGRAPPGHRHAGQVAA